MPKQNAVAQRTPGEVLDQQITKHAPLYTKLLGCSKSQGYAWCTAAWNICRMNPRLMEADRWSLLMTLGEAAALGFSIQPSLGEYFLIPRNIKDRAGEKRLMVTGQTGYQGYLSLARRHDDIRIIASVVRRGDTFRDHRGTDPRLEHIVAHDEDPEYNSDDAITHAYCCTWIGESKYPQFRVLSRAKIEESRSRSDDPRNQNKWSSAWAHNFEGMCIATAIRRGAKLLPRGMKVREVSAREDERDAGRDPGPIVSDLNEIQIEQEDDLMTATKKPMPPK